MQGRFIKNSSTTKARRQASYPEKPRAWMCWNSMHANSTTAGPCTEAMGSRLPWHVVSTDGGTSASEAYIDMTSAVSATQRGVWRQLWWTRAGAGAIFLASVSQYEGLTSASSPICTARGVTCGGRRDMVRQGEQRTRNKGVSIRVSRMASPPRTL